MNENGIRHVFTAPGHPSTNGQAEIFVKIIKKSVYATLRERPNENFEAVMNRFLADYRNTKHCTTDETPTKLFLGRSVKTRLDFLRPPTVREIVLQKQIKSIENYKGKRKIEYSNGQKVYVRDYRNPNKPSWSPGTITEQLGAKTYLCNLTNNDKVIKQHTDQIRKAIETKSNEIPLGVEDTMNSVNHDIDLEKETADGVEASRRDETHNTTSKRTLRPRKDGKVMKM